MRAVMQKTTLQISLRCAMLSKSPRIRLQKDTVLKLIIASKICWRMRTWILSMLRPGEMRTAVGTMNRRWRLSPLADTFCVKNPCPTILTKPAIWSLMPQNKICTSAAISTIIFLNRRTKRENILQKAKWANKFTVFTRWVLQVVKRLIDQAKGLSRGDIPIFTLRLFSRILSA